MLRLSALSFKLVLLACMLFTSTAHAQIDSLLLAPFKEKRKLTYGLINRQTQLMDESSTIYGAYVGVKHGDRMKHVFTINSNVVLPAFQQPAVQLGFIGIAEEYTFLTRGRFSFHLYTHLGLGSTRLVDEITALPIPPRKWVLPLEGGLHTSFAVNSWLKANAGAGYRSVALYGSNELDGGYYKVGLSMDVFRYMERREQTGHWLPIGE